MSENFENCSEPKQPCDAHHVKSAMRKDPNVDSSLSSVIVHESRPDDGSNNVAIASSDEECMSKKKKALTWDEPAIEEHDLLRGTRMKVCKIECLMLKTLSSAVVLVCRVLFSLIILKPLTFSSFHLALYHKF